MRAVAMVTLVVGACGFPALPALDKPLDAQPGQVADAPPELDAAPDIDAAPAVDAPEIDAVPIDGPAAKLAMTLDPATLATELKTTSTFAVTLTGSNGFAGAVGLSVSVGDPGTGAAIPGWVADLDHTSVTVPLDGTILAHVTLRIAALHTALAGKIKVSVTSGASGTPDATAQVTAVNQLTWAVGIDAATGACTYPADGGTPGSPVLISQNDTSSASSTPARSTS